MKVTIYLTKGRVRIQSMSGDAVMQMIEDWAQRDNPVLMFKLDDESTTYIARRHITRIDVDPEERA